ncbi:hypothetical protein [Micromonospora sp. SL4-19]|uniref:hypothetical protein n=1 Tax=Micromonospora sp. SL4-19 TaxID=3399129 RepID=UPI003A4D618B
MPHHRPAEPDIQRYYSEVFAEADRLHRTPQGRLEARRNQVAALREAARLTRPGGPVVGAVISRNAALIDLTAQGRVDERTRRLLLGAYATGVNDPETGFTTAYFHRPEQVVEEFTATGLPVPRLYGVEGPLWPLLDALDTGPDDQLFHDAVACAAAFEQDPAVLGASAHLLAVAPA